MSIKVYYIAALNKGPIQKTYDPNSESFFIDDNQEIPVNSKQILQKKYLAKKKRAFEPEAKSKIVITVLDTGAGISDQDQKKLFKMFGCLKSTQQMNTQGIGLGLFICRQIVD